MSTFKHPTLGYPLTVTSDLLVTSVAVESAGGHDRVTIWNRGGNAGTLTVNAGDGAVIAALLIPNAREDG